MFLHVLHNLLKRLLLFDVHAIAYLLLVLPVINHRKICVAPRDRIHEDGFDGFDVGGGCGLFR